MRGQYYLRVDVIGHIDQGRAEVLEVAEQSGDVLLGDVQLLHQRGHRQSHLLILLLDIGLPAAQHRRDEPPEGEPVHAVGVDVPLQLPHVAAPEY